MERSKILEHMTELFRSVLDNPDLVLSEDMTSENVNEWDSLSNIQLAIAVEERFGIRFTLDEIQRFKTVGEICGLVEQKMELVR